MAWPRVAMRRGVSATGAALVDDQACVNGSLRNRGPALRGSEGSGLALLAGAAVPGRPYNDVMQDRRA
jgi:hypothetical protein